jgi:hypothetical protein
MYASTFLGSDALVFISIIFGMFVNPDHNLLESVWDETTWDIAAEMISHFSRGPITLGGKICISDGVRLYFSERGTSNPL